MYVASESEALLLLLYEKDMQEERSELNDMKMTEEYHGITRRGIAEA
jgi:hypothetical protein